MKFGPKKSFNNARLLNVVKRKYKVAFLLYTLASQTDDCYFDKHTALEKSPKINNRQGNFGKKL